MGVRDDAAIAWDVAHEGAGGTGGGGGRPVQRATITNTLWAFAKMGREPGKGLMRELEALAGTFNARDVAATLWDGCVFSTFHATQERI